MTPPLIEYYLQHIQSTDNLSEINTDTLRTTVMEHMFSSLNLTTKDIDCLLNLFKIKPQNQINRRKQQLKTIFNNNSNQREIIINYVNEKNALSQNDESTNDQTSEHTNKTNIPPYVNPFYPENLEEIEQNRRALRLSREQRTAELRTGNFNLLNNTGPNPILEMGKEMYEALRNIQWGHCMICNERWPDLKVGPKSKKCQRCADDRVQPPIPHTFSAANDMDPGEQPECLKVLNTVEAAAISLICPVVSIYKVKYGATGMKGHSISFHQNVQEFINVLPRAPEDLPLIVIKAPNQPVPLTANRFHILDALAFLKRNNPHYKNIVIDQSQANKYPDNSSTPVQGIRSFEEGHAGEVVQSQNVDGTAFPNQDTHADLDDNDLVETVAATDMPTSTVNDQIRDAILGERPEQNQQNKPICWPPRSDNPASEFEPGFFSKSFPHLFPYGAGDFTNPRLGKNPSLLDYIQHLIRLPDNRFAADPRFVLCATNMFRRWKSLTLGNVFAQNVCPNMSMDELKKLVDEDNEAIKKSLILFSSQIPGTKAYFGQEMKKSVAMERWVRIMSDGEEMLNVFLTFSLADIHMEELHMLLPGHEQYLGKTVVKSLDDIPPNADASQYIDEKTDNRLRRKALNDNGHLVDFFAKKKLDVLVEKVLKNTLGITDYIIRCEYQSRKAIHFHMAGRMIGLSMRDIELACKTYSFDVRGSTQAEAEMTKQERDEQREALIKLGIIMDHPDIDEASVQDSRNRVIDFAVKDFGLSACHPEKDPKKWPGPEGQAASAPPTHCLRQNYLELSDFEQHYEQLINRVQLHRCTRTYCLQGGNNCICRFGFPISLKGFTINYLQVDGKLQIMDELEREDNFQDGAEFSKGDLEFLRNHARLVMHVPELLAVWQANTDQKLIDSPAKLMRYILKYMMKPEEGSLAFSDIVKTITGNAGNDSPIRKVFQKILLKLVGEHDISKNECFKIISKEPYVFYSRPFRALNLTSTRRVDTKKTGDQPALVKNYCDIYWSRDTDPNFLLFVDDYENGLVAYPMHPRDVSLYRFASEFSHSWRLQHKLFVPNPTPYFKYVPIPANVKYRSVYCETKLLLHKPGATPDNILENNSDVESAMHDFVFNNPMCPTVIKKEFITSLEQTPEQAAQALDDVEDLVPSPGSQLPILDQDEWMTGLGNHIEQTDINDPEPMFEEDPFEHEAEIVFDENADWSADRVELGLTNQQIDNAVNWIERERLSGELDTEETVQIDPNTLNTDQRRVYDTIMNILQSEDAAAQKLIDVSGGAGTGKSYLIQTILQKAYELSGHRHLVKIAAPTGCAASQFTGGLTLHSLLNIPAAKGCGELDDLEGIRLGALQDRFKYTRVLIIDEKGMIGVGRLNQIHARLKQAKPEHADKLFGGLTVMLAGDLRQLAPVGDYTLFSTTGGDTPHQQGRMLYRMFDESSFCLRAQMRQQGADNEDFRQQLERLANGQFTVFDWQNWSQRNMATFSDEEKENFIQNATMICAKKKDMMAFNCHHLSELKTPISKLKADNSKGSTQIYVCILWIYCTFKS